MRGVSDRRHRRARRGRRPTCAQPYAELGLKDDEYAPDPRDPRPPADQRRAGDVLGDVERALLLQVVARCTCGSSARRRRKTDALLVGMGENAGVVDVGDGWAVTFKVESHNHPSYVEPYQGAATGVGGIVRDILTMGARPVAVMDPLRFGPADAPGHRAGAARRRRRHRRLRQLPRPAEHRRRGRLRRRPTSATRWSTRCASACCAPTASSWPRPTAPGNQVVLFGARTGGDGIGGASVLASARRSTTRSRAKRPSVQVGDPFAEKVLIECCLEIFAADLVVGIQDLGAAGLSCATTELAAAGTGGMHVDLDLVPLRDADARARRDPDERVAGTHDGGRRRRRTLDAFLAICAQVGRHWPPSSATVTDTGRLRIDWHGELIVDVPPRTAAHEGPVYERPIERPARPGRAASTDDGRDLPRPRTGDELRATLLRLVALAEPGRQVVGHRPVRPLRAGQHRAGPAGGRRHGPARRVDRPRASRSRPTATAATPGSTRTPARSSRWPRRTATSPPPAPGRSRSPTA